MIQVSILLQPHRTVVADFVPGNFGLAAEPLATTVEKHCPNVIKFHEGKLRPV